MSPWISVMSHWISVISPWIVVILLFMVFTAVATTQFWIALVDVVFNDASTTGLLFKSP